MSNAQKELTDLANLLNYGHKFLCHQNIQVFKLRGAKKIFFSMLTAAHNYSEAVFFLCGENRSHPCFTLLRPLCENLINAKFLYCNPRKHYLIICVDGLMEKEKQISHAIRYYSSSSQIPTHKEYSLKDLKKNLHRVVGSIKRVEININKHPGSMILDTLGRAQYVDKHNRRKNRTSQSLEEIYLLIYRQLCSSTHLNILELENFFKVEEGTLVVHLSGNADDIVLVLHLTFFLYKEMLRQFFAVFKIPMEKEFKKMASVQREADRG